MKSYLELIEAELRQFRLELQLSEKAALARYCEELVRWNQRVNLTGLAGSEMVRRLVVEPVWIAGQLDLHSADTLLDIGSGNGSPAIPILLVKSLKGAHLVEARTKRAAFLRHMVALLQLPNVAVHRCRFEDLRRDFVQPDWITLQAVALDSELLKGLRALAHETTTVVWITSARVAAPLTPKRVIEVPITGSRAFLFGLEPVSA